MVVGRICSCMVIGLNMGERFLVRMLNHSQEVPGKDACESHLYVKVLSSIFFFIFSVRVAESPSFFF